MGSGPAFLFLDPFPDELVFTGLQQEPALEREDGSAQHPGAMCSPHHCRGPGRASGPEYI